MKFLPQFLRRHSVSINSLFAWLEGRKDVVRSFHFIYCLFPFWFFFTCCKLSTLSRLILHSELGIGWPKKLDIIFQKLSADFDILLQDDRGQCSGIIQVALTTACQLITLLSIESYFKLNVVNVFHSVLKTFHTEFDMWLSLNYVCHSRVPGLLSSMNLHSPQSCLMAVCLAFEIK